MMALLKVPTMSATNLISATGSKPIGRKDGRGPARSPTESIPASALPPTVPSATGAPPLTRVASALARRFQQVCATMIAGALAGEEVVQLEYGSLLCLEIEPGMDQRRLAEAMGIDPSHASLIVERLHAKGLIERRIKDGDRRARELYLTRKGRRLWRRIRPKTNAANERVLAPLAPHERKLLLDLLIRVIEGNRAHARPGAGRRKRGSLQSLLASKPST
jgi:DNA-binding MarR family transcriptional regulator